MTHDQPDRFGADGATFGPDAEADPPRLDAAPVPPPPRPEVYSLREVAAIFGRTERTIRSWVKAGHLQRGGFGNALFFSRAAIEALLNGRRETDDAAKQSKSLACTRAGITYSKPTFED